MSVISQRSRGSSTPSSILKKPKSFKSKLENLKSEELPLRKVRFSLLHSPNIQNILKQYVKTKESKDYENLLCLIRDSTLMEDDISSLLKEATECISLLNNDLSLFVEALLSINWIDKQSELVTEYQSFIVNLLSANNYHANSVIEKLVRLFLPDSDVEWDDGIPSDVDSLKCGNIHILLNALINVLPMCKELLMVSIINLFPYHNKSTHIHEYYIHNILWILEYQPSFRLDILQLIFSKLVAMDVNAPREEIEKYYNLGDEIFMMDDDVKSVKSTSTSFTQINRPSLAHTLDVCLEKIFNYYISECHNTKTKELDWEKTKKLYHDTICVFDKVILPTYNTHHVQYIMFLMCNFKNTISEAFLNYLWKKVCNPNVAPVIRQAAVNYIASLVARAKFVPLIMLKGPLHQMSEWIHTYISNQDGLESINSDVRVHSVFYSICQALFYIVSFRHKDFVKTTKNIIFLNSLNLAKMVTSRLNPLRVCQPAVVQNFAAVTRKYQLAYCYSVMEHNSRNTIPIIYQDEKGASVISSNVLDAFYPFDPYILERSGEKIQPLYRQYQESIEESMETDAKQCSGEVHVKQSSSEVDDFLYNHDISTTPNSRTHTFSYSSSPGFKLKGYGFLN